MYLLGFDIGSSSVKASLLQADNGYCIGSAFSPKTEMTIISKKAGWAEQEPESWWQNLVNATHELLANTKINPADIDAIGISYQMHGLVLLDKNKKVIRPSIIWCDSRAVEIGNKAFQELGEENCLSSVLNSPGNFTASKLKWVKDNEPALYSEVWKIMLPGDYIAFKLTDSVNTTSSGLSEGILWNFKLDSVSEMLLDYYGFSSKLIPDLLPTFSMQGRVSEAAASELGLVKGIPVAYRAGDQPNNAFSLNVLNPGEIAATAGTSGVVYGVSGEVKYDPKSRVNTFAHVNHSKLNPRLGVLLCINGTGILNSWLRKNLFEQSDYNEINKIAAEVPAGSEGLCILPFGNGAERVLSNRETGCHIANLNFNIHSKAHLARAAQEGIIFSFTFGLEIMKSVGINPKVIRAGNANMFLSPLFTQMLATISGADIELYNTDGSQGAARGAGIGAGIYKNSTEAFSTLKKIRTITPEKAMQEPLEKAYQIWLNELKKHL